jgi:hypothetical protein
LANHNATFLSHIKTFTSTREHHHQASSILSVEREDENVEVITRQIRKQIKGEKHFSVFVFLLIQDECRMVPCLLCVDVVQGGVRGRPAMRVRQQTDENAQVHSTRQAGIIGKTLGVQTTENVQGQGVAVRPLVGKVIGGLKGGARRATLGDLGNANQATLTQKVVVLRLS